MKLADTCIRRPVFAVMLAGSLVALGLLAVPRLPVDLFPRVEFPYVTVRTVLEGAAPETVEREITQVLEEAINTIEGIRMLRSMSSHSLSLVFVEFELEYDVHEKAQEVRDKVAAVRAELPEDADPPVIERVDPGDQPVLAVMVAGPHSIRALSEYADKRIKPRLERIPGVGSVQLVGSRPREVRIWIDPVRLAGHSLTVEDVLHALGREHVELPGGRIETPELEYTVRIQGKVGAVETFGEIPVATRGGRVLRLRDVATVEDGQAEERMASYLDGRRGVALFVRRQSGENTVAVVDAVRAELEKIRRHLPPGYQLVEAMDLSRFIRSAVRDVTVDLAWGAFLASVVVLVFLRDLRSTSIAVVTIPCSVVGTLAFFYFFGFTLNTMTLMALSLSVGILIDDAVVVLENSYRHVELGEPPKEAASRATAEVGLAVVATTLALCAVFVPIAFLGGVVGRFFREFGLVASCAVSTSTLVALTLTPMLCSRFLRRGKGTGRLFVGLERGYASLERRYRSALAWALRHRALVLALALSAVAAGIFVGRRVPVDFLAVEDRSEFHVWLKMPLGTTLENARRTARVVEEKIRALPEVRAVFTTVGGDIQRRVNEARIYVQLEHKSRRERGQMELMARVREVIAESGLPLEDHAVEEIPPVDIPGGRSAQIMYSIRGPDVATLDRLARQLVARMRAAGGYADLYVSHEVGNPEVELTIDRERAALSGVSTLQVGRAISALFAGVRATTYEEGGERYDVRVQIRPEYRDDPSKITLLRVRSASGALVPLENLVRTRIRSGPVRIDRENRTRVVRIYGNLEGKAAGTADREVVRFARELDFPPGYELAAIGYTERLRETQRAIAFALVVALVAIYMILASQFDSFAHPLTIMTSAPLSFVGAAASVAILGYSLDIMAQIAFVMLMGIVMKNGILLVDYTNTLRRRGKPLLEAVLEAGPTRMRPVLMTAVSTIFGMLPVATSTGDGSEWRNPMGVVAIGGLAASTLLTLLVVPVVYTLFDDAGRWLARSLRAEGRAEVTELGVAAEARRLPSR